MKKTLFFLMILWLVTSCGADRNLHRGEKFLALGEYYDAANEFRQAYQKTPAKERTKRGQIARKMAICYDKSLQSARALAPHGAMPYAISRPTRRTVWLSRRC